MKNLKFPFTSEGVQDWKNKLYESTEEEIFQEQQLIALNLQAWLPSRFELEDSQIAYMQSLGTLTLEQIGIDINQAINNRANITVQREQPQPGKDNSKVTDSSKKYQPKSDLNDAKAKTIDDTLVSLDFHFYYTTNTE